MQLFWPAWYGFGGRYGQSMWECCCMAGTTERWRRVFATLCVCASEWWSVTCLLLTHGVAFKLGALLGMFRTVASSTDVNGVWAQQVRGEISAMLCSLHRIGLCMEKATTWKYSTGSSISLRLLSLAARKARIRVVMGVAAQRAGVRRNGERRPDFRGDGSEESSFEPVWALLRGG